MKFKKGMGRKEKATAKEFKFYAEVRLMGDGFQGKNGYSKQHKYDRFSQLRLLAGCKLHFAIKTPVYQTSFKK